MAEPVERRLVMILAADIVEYSRLMRADEDGAFAALTKRTRPPRPSGARCSASGCISAT